MIVVNDTLAPAGGEVEITDCDTGKRLFVSLFHVEPNDKAVVGRLPAVRHSAMWLIRWRDNEGSAYLNHYLAGERPFKLERYRQWLQALEIPKDIGSVYQNIT